MSPSLGISPVQVGTGTKGVMYFHLSLPQLTCKGVTAVLEVPRCRSLKNTTALSGLVRCVGVVGNAGIKNTVPMPWGLCWQSRCRGRTGSKLKTQIRILQLHECKGREAGRKQGNPTNPGATAIQEGYDQRDML